MKKNENIYISLQIQKDQTSKGFFLSVEFNKNAPNFSVESEALSWYPTSDEIDLISEAFQLIGSKKSPEERTDEKQITKFSSKTTTMEPHHSSSEMRIAPLPEETTQEEPKDIEILPSKNKENEEKIFIQADEKTIDELLRRKKSIVEEDHGIGSSEKILIDRMLKQKKKK